jgi:hypothetical protein
VAAFLAAGCSQHVAAGTAPTQGSDETVAPTAVVTTGTTTTTAGLRSYAPAPSTRPPGATTARAAAPGRVPPAGSEPALPTGVYVGRFSAIDTARKRARLTITGSDPECSGPQSGTYVVDLTNTTFVGTSGSGMGEALDLTFEDWANDWADRDNWTVLNLPDHELVTNGVHPGCHP